MHFSRNEEADGSKLSVGYFCFLHEFVKMFTTEFHLGPMISDKETLTTLYSTTPIIVTHDITEDIA